jgi:peptide/nickel transport system substrate-binding protein
MEKKSKINRGLIALATLAEEGFLADMGDSNQARVYPLVYDYEFYNDEKAKELIPGLAKRFEYSKDNLTLTLYLQEGVQFHEGWGEVTAEDFKYTYDRCMRPESVNLRKELYDEIVKSVEVVNRYTVAVHLKKYAPEFFKDFSPAVNPYMGILSKKYVEKVGDDKARFNPIGTGPYRLVEYKAGQYMKFEAYEKHWRVIPEYKYITVQIVPEESSRVAMLKGGETDIAPITALSMADLKKVKGITAKAWIGGYNVYLTFGGMITPKDKRYKKGYHLSDPWVDKRVRIAMNLAIDREAIVKAIYGGAARPIPVCWSLKGWDKLPLIPYDPEKAKQLLAEAGYPNGFDVTISTSHDWAPMLESPSIMQIVAAYLKKIGLNAKIKMMDKALVTGAAREGNDVGSLHNWKDSYKDSHAGQFNDKFYPSLTGKGIVCWYTSEELTTSIDNYEAELDIQKRDAALAKVLNYLYNEYTTIPIVMGSPAWASRDAVVGEWPMSTGDKSHNFEYIRHPKPLNTWRLFTPGQ